MALKYTGMANHFVTACTSLNDKRTSHMAIESGYFVNGTRGYIFSWSCRNEGCPANSCASVETILIFGLHFDFIRFVSYSNHW